MNVLIERARWLLSALLAAAAALFAIGVAIERADADHHHEATELDDDRSAEGDEDAESGEAGAHEEAENAAHSEEEEEEKLLGLNLESTPLVVAGVIVSVGLAALVWARQNRWLLWAVAAFAAGFTVLDLAELLHQVDEERIGVAVIAAIVATLHASAAFVSASRATAATE